MKFLMMLTTLLTSLSVFACPSKMFAITGVSGETMMTVSGDYIATKGDFVQSVPGKVFKFKNQYGSYVIVNNKEEVNRNQNLVIHYGVSFVPETSMGLVFYNGKVELETNILVDSNGNKLYPKGYSDKVQKVSLFSTTDNTRNPVVKLSSRCN